MPIPPPPHPSLVRGLILLPVTWPFRVADSLPIAHHFVPGLLKPAPLVSREQVALARQGAGLARDMFGLWLVWLRESVWRSADDGRPDRAL